MKLGSLRAIDAFVRLGGTGEAAQGLGISQSAVIKTLRQAEEELDLSLATTAQGRLVPTPEAHSLVRQAQPLFGALRRARHEADMIRVGMANRLRVATVPGLAHSILPPAITRTRQALDQSAAVEIMFDHVREHLATGEADLGISYANNRPIAELIAGRLGNSLQLAAATALFSVPIALALGITSAMLRGSLYDRSVTMATITVISVPEFMIATSGVLIFAVWLKWLPALSFARDVHSFGEMLRIYAMPVFTLSFVISAQMIRMSRAAVVETLNTPYVEMAQLKGASRTRVVLRHALPNALGPIVNAVALSLSYLLGGVIIVETIFNYPGIAKLMLDAVSTRDLPLIQTCAMIFCLGYLILITVADLIAIMSNPRLR